MKTKLRIKREFTAKQIAEQVNFHKNKGAYSVFIYNPIVKMGSVKVKDVVLYKGKKYRVHSFKQLKNVNHVYIQRLTKKEKIDLRIINKFVPIAEFLK